jgi:hypothetical protein
VLEAADEIRKQEDHRSNYKSKKTEENRSWKLKKQIKFKKIEVRKSSSRKQKLEVGK